MTWPNNDSICLDLVAADIIPDYGAENVMDTVHWCFFPSLTTCNYYPNPFTPNGDDINEAVWFTYPYMALREGIIRIFDLGNNPIWDSPGGSSFWDGRTNSGITAVPGLYLFIIEHEGEVVCSGTVLLIR
jgi:hypothetical protein